MAVDPNVLHGGVASHEKTALYRQFDANNVLLYVGASIAPTSRFAQHRSGASWYQRVARIEIQWFSNYMEAIAAERVAIRTEHPLFNTMRYAGCADEEMIARQRAYRERKKATA